jgi:hypothetical protein
VTDDELETLRKLRLGNLRTLFRARYGPVLPDDDQGREDIRELLLPISIGPNAGIKMPKAIELWAPWMDQREAEWLMDDINQTPIWDRRPSNKVLGDRQNVTNVERERLRIWTIAACDMTAEQALEWRKAKNRARMRKRRQLKGIKSRADYLAGCLSQTKPWIAAGFKNRRTWERRGKPIVATQVRDNASSSQHRLATLSKPNCPKELSSIHVSVSLEQQLIRWTVLPVMLI